MKLPLIKRIDKEAKRELKNAKKFKDDNQLLFIGFVLLLAAGVIINTAYVINRSSVANTTTQSNQIDDVILKSLDKAVTPSTTVSISNVTEDDKQDPAFPLNEGETLLVLDISITNHTSSIQQIIPTSQMFVHDRDGGLYPVQASIHVRNPLAAQDVAPGQTASGQLAFGVPKRQTMPLLFVDLGWDERVPIVFDVLH